MNSSGFYVMALLLRCCAESWEQKNEELQAAVDKGMRILKQVKYLLRW